MQKVAGKIVIWLIKQEAIRDDEKELYEYAVCSLFMMIVTVVLAIFIGFCFGVFIESIILILPFMLIRKFSGGYHAKRQTICLCISSMLLFLSFWIADRVIINVGFHVVVFMASISLSVFSPVDSENRKLDSEEIISYRKTSRMFVFIFLAIYLLLCFTKKNHFAGYLAMGILLPAELQDQMKN